MGERNVANQDILFSTHQYSWVHFVALAWRANLLFLAFNTESLNDYFQSESLPLDLSCDMSTGSVSDDVISKNKVNPSLFLMLIVVIIMPHTLG